MILVFYSWTAFSGAAGSSVAMGITDDRGRAMRAGEESLGSGQALLVIIEAVRPAMAPAHAGSVLRPDRGGLAGPAHRIGRGDLAPGFHGGRSG